MDNAIEIVMALADSHPISYQDTWHWCALCDVTLPVNISDHKESCPWRRAVEFVETTSSRKV